MEGIHEADAACPAETATDRGEAPAEALAEALAEPGRRVAEQRMYRALVDRACGTARGPTAQDAWDAWAEAVPELRVSWEILREKYRHEERAEPAPQADGGSWRGKGGRALDAASNAEIDLGYARIREVGENVIAPAILRVAAEDPTRTLAGFDRRIKGEDRLKEKVSDLLERSIKAGSSRGIPQSLTSCGSRSRTARIAIRRVSWQDVERLEVTGFQLGQGNEHVDSRAVQGNQHAMAGTGLWGTLRGAVSHAGQP